jgi:hypothetical protein
MGDFPFDRAYYMVFDGLVHQVFPQEWQQPGCITRAHCACGKRVNDGKKHQVTEAALTCVGCIVKEVVL